MKKFIFLAMAGWMCIGLSAQMTRKMPFQSIMRTSIQQERKQPIGLPHTARAPKAVKEELSDTLIYYRSRGTFYGGLWSDGYNTDPVIFVPADYPNEMGHLWNYSWKHTDDPIFWGYGAELVDSTYDFYLENVYEELKEGYVYPFPSLYTVDTTQEDDWQIIRAYQYGGPYAEYSYGLVIGTIDEEGNPFAVPMTTCAMYTDTIFEPADPEIGYDGGLDFWAVGGRDGGEYLFGTNFDYAAAISEGTSLTKQVIDTIGVIYDNISSMVVDTVLLPIYKMENAYKITDMIPDGQTLKLDVYPLSVNDSNEWVVGTEILASAEATNKDITIFEAEEGFAFAMLSFVFKTADPFGGVSISPVQFDGPFFCQISGLANKNCDFGIYSDFSNYSEPTTFYTYEGDHFLDFMSCNIALTLNAYFGELPQTDLKQAKANRSGAKKVIKKNGQIMIQHKNKEYNILGLEK